MIKTVHGGDIYTSDILYDFSANINPSGVPESVKISITNNLDLIEKYPDVNCTQLKKSLSDFEKVAFENIVCGNGASDIIYRIVQTIMPKKSLVLAPTFSEYEKALKTFGCDVKYFNLDEKNDFNTNEHILKSICDVDIFFLCNPNNPVGNLVNTDLMGRIIKKCSEENIYLVVDECFMDFVEESYKYKVGLNFKNVIVLRAFTKIFSMPGLRLGYMLCGDTDFCERVENCGQCWNVSTIAQLAGVTVLSEKGFVEKTVSLVKNEREFLISNLKRFGFKVYNSHTNFILFKTDLPLDELLMKNKIAIRNCSNYENLSKGYFRIAVRTHKENEILIENIKRILNVKGILKNG